MKFSDMPGYTPSLRADAETAGCDAFGKTVVVAARARSGAVAGTGPREVKLRVT